MARRRTKRQVGTEVQVGSGTFAIDQPLSVMEFDPAASRSNAVAAALTVLLRLHWPGGKPLVLVTATKSHAGKGTLASFICGRCPTVDIRFDSKDWPMEWSLHAQLQRSPESGVILFDNVRRRSAGVGKEISTAPFESIITDSKLSLNAAGHRHGYREPNRFVALININEGSCPRICVTDRCRSIWPRPATSRSESCG